MNLNIAIVGGGIAGITTAIALRTHGQRSHRVTVYEKYPDVQPPFSGPIQLPPNATRILTRYGVADAIQKCVPELRSVHNAHRYSDGKLLHSAPASVVLNAHGSPIWNISRSSLLEILRDRAEAAGVEFRLSTEVFDVDTEAQHPAIDTKLGPCSYDLVIAADVTAYSINVPRMALAADPDLEFMLNRSGFWSGPSRSVNQMDMPDFNDSCNFCFSQEGGRGVEGDWDAVCSVDEVKENFSSFDARLHKVLSLADGACYLWRLSDIPALGTWRSKSNCVLLVGDAAHAMVPFAAMGAASSIEDSLCLAECLAQADGLDAALEAFEAIRKPRTTFIAEAGRQNMKMAHLPDGPDQEARDDAYVRNAALNNSQSPKLPEPEAVLAQAGFEPPATPTGSFVPATRKYLLSYDVLEHTQAFFNKAAK